MLIQAVVTTVTVLAVSWVLAQIWPNLVPSVLSGAKPNLDR